MDHSAFLNYKLAKAKEWLIFNNMRYFLLDNLSKEVSMKFQKKKHNKTFK